MFRKSDALSVEVPKEPSTDIDLSKLYCRVTLPAETMGIHVIQFNKTLTEDNSYFCVDIKNLSMYIYTYKFNNLYKKKKEKNIFLHCNWVVMMVLNS